MYAKVRHSFFKKTTERYCFQAFEEDEIIEPGCHLLVEDQFNFFDLENEEYNNFYFFSKKTEQLFFIKDKQKELVPILDKEKFKQVFSDLMDNEKLHYSIRYLSKGEIHELITTNCGHTHIPHHKITNLKLI